MLMLSYANILAVALVNATAAPDVLTDSALFLLLKNK